jgi:hypothetical protein
MPNILRNCAATVHVSPQNILHIFKDWVMSEEARNEMGEGAPCGVFQSPRYTYCVHADADVIDSVVNCAPHPPEYDRREIAHVKLVQLSDGEWDLDMPDTGDGDEDVEDEEDFEGDENFVKVPLRCQYIR